MDKVKLLKGWQSFFNFTTSKKGEVVKIGFFKLLALYFKIYEEVADDIIKYTKKYKNQIESIIVICYDSLSSNPDFESDCKEIKEKYITLFKLINSSSDDTAKQLEEIEKEEDTDSDKLH